MTDCGHRCCQISGNAYHSHLEAPERCRKCAALDDEVTTPDPVAPDPLVAAGDAAGPARAPNVSPARRATTIDLGDAEPTGADDDLVGLDVGHITSSVLTRIAPEIPGLPVGPELGDLVDALTIDVYLDALEDPDLHGIDAREWRRALAGRIGLALAFDAAGPPRAGADGRPAPAT